MDPSLRRERCARGACHPAFGRTHVYPHGATGRVADGRLRRTCLGPPTSGSYPVTNATPRIPAAGTGQRRSTGESDRCAVGHPAARSLATRLPSGIPRGQRDVKDAWVRWHRSCCLRLAVVIQHLPIEVEIDRGDGCLIPPQVNAVDYRELRSQHRPERVLAVDIARHTDLLRFLRESPSV